MPACALDGGRLRPARTTEQGIVAARALARALLAATVVALLALLLACVPSHAQSPTGGSFGAPPPVVSDLVCRTSCAGVRNARPGATVRVRGRHLAAVREVRFAGGPGAADDVTAPPLAAKATWLDAQVPSGAVAGPVVLVNADGARSRPSRTRLGIDANAVLKRSAPLGERGAPGLDLDVSARRVYFGGGRPATLTYLVRDPAPVTATVELRRVDDGATIMRWPATTVAPETPQTVTWDGKAGGAVQKEGRYAFHVTVENGKGAVASSSQAAGPGDPAPGSFTFLRHIFPVRGKHDYGEFAATFGGGRGHQGQDVFARCGTPLVAARAGTVRIKDTHSAAGNFLVIDGDGTSVEHVYMHLRDPGLVEVGERVATGQRIGYVGQTGRASGCHLHFELWSAPGWYRGGAASDPLPQLRAWDAQS